MIVVALPPSATGLSAVCDCDISGSYSLAIFDFYAYHSIGFEVPLLACVLVCLPLGNIVGLLSILVVFLCHINSFLCY